MGGRPTAEDLHQAAWRKLWKLTHSNAFQVVVSLAIMLNVICIGFSTHFILRAAIENNSVSPVWSILDLCFCVFFSSELALRLAAERSLFFRGGEWKWNVFDLVLVLLSF